MCASQLCSRHILYEVHIVQATMNRFDDILGLSLFATAAFTDMQTAQTRGRLVHSPTCPIVALASSAIARMRSQCQDSDLASSYKALHRPDILLKI